MATDKLTDKVVATSLRILAGAPDGVRFTELVERIQKEVGGQENTVQTMVAHYVAKHPDVYKPERGLYRSRRFESAAAEPLAKRPVVSGAGKVKVEVAAIDETPASPAERAFYEPFRDWLMNEAEECTKALVLGGNKFGGKWGTPDVIGVWKPQPGDIVRPPEEIVSAEIKVEATQLITAFGQACAYKLFSHKSYIVVPRTSSKQDLGRIDSLCQIFGIGLVTFDPTNSTKPDFAIRTRPSRHDPDVFYMNEMAKNIVDLFT